jgi:protein-S-isoprenylcysteine O-methyltransferase Ste14
MLQQGAEPWRLAYWIKARKEESMLAAQFGEAFEEHCLHTGFLIPKFW